MGDHGATLFKSHLEISQCLQQHGSTVGWFEDNALGAHTGILQQVVEERLHAMAPVDSMVDELLALRVELPGVPLLEELQAPDHRAQRFLQVVGCGIRELF
jgi:hypothetical protein